MRRIADLEQELGIWPPWELVAEPWYDMEGGAGVTYRRPSHDQIERPPSWAKV